MNQEPEPYTIGTIGPGHQVTCNLPGCTWSRKADIRARAETLLLNHRRAHVAKDLPYVHPRGPCPACGREIGIHPNKGYYPHETPQGGYCEGSGRRP